MSETVVVDKSGWPNGPWMSEPDRLEWRHASGLPCLIVRNDSGALCGYVGVPPRHPWHGQDYDDVDAEVHGGLTYADKCGGPICHVPAPGEPDDVWWLGFDTAHCGDRIPSYDRAERNGTYRNVAYVRAEVERLARQAVQVALMPSEPAAGAPDVAPAEGLGVESAAPTKVEGA